MGKTKFGFTHVPYNLDRKLYKYYNNIDYAISNLKNKCIHLDDIRQFNDPFEALFLKKNYTSWSLKKKFSIVFKDVFEYIIKTPSQQKHQVWEKVFRSLVRLRERQEFISIDNEYPIKEIIKKIYENLRGPNFSYEDFCDVIERGYLASNPFFRINCKMSCFSEINDSLLMWSYYANKHNGVCVEYDLSRLDFEIEINKQIYQSISRVHYSHHRADTLTGFPVEDTYLNLLLTKADVWSHESEWRLICETQEEFLPFSCASAVYIGTNFNTNSKKYRELIDAVNTYNNMKIYKCKLDSEKYQLNFEEIYDVQIHHLLKEVN